MNRTWLSIVAAAGLALAVVGVGVSGCAEYRPEESWRTCTPEAQGFSSAELAKAFDFVADRQVNIHSLLIVRHGYLLLEAYFYPNSPGDLHDVCSCTKSVSSTLIGIALQQGRIRSLQETLGELFPERSLANDSPAKRRITLEHLLTMSSGMDYPLLGEPRLAPMRAAPDMVQHVLDLPMAAEPGAVFGYNSGGSHLLSAIISLRTGQSAEQYAREQLFGPLGVTRLSWPSDGQGNSFGWGDLRLTSPDMARIGYLFLHKGRWGGKRIVSGRWVREATRRHIDTPDEGAGYGYQWWVREGPGRYYEALGRGGQRIVVLPSLDMVVVFTGGGFEPAEVGEYILGALRSAGPLPEDPAGYALLQARIAEAARPPAARPVPALPATAAAISGKRYRLEENPLQLTAIGFRFEGGDTALLELEVEGHEETRPIGLDGVYRLSRAGPDAQDAALRGEWLSENEFRLVYNEFTSAQYTTATTLFDGEAIRLRLQDPWNDLDLLVEGRAER